MAFNFSTFRVRAFSAIVFAIIMLGGIMYNQWSFFILFTVIQIGCLYEFQKLMARIEPTYATISSVHQWGTLLIGTLFMIGLSPASLKIGPYSIAYYGRYVLLAVIALVLIIELVTRKFNFKAVTTSAVGLIYVSMGLSLFFQLRSIMADSIFGDLGFAFPLLLIISIWINDTAAYIVGSVIGRTPLSSVSPNKTWEGTIAGIVISVFLITKTFGAYIPINQKVIFLVSLVAAVMGTLGDLVESKLKRLAGVKDSGKMMPGHGGFLDRFDSILLATPFVWLLIQLLH
jgi:phosphatidate cytidylyltransferase